MTNRQTVILEAE